MIRKNLFFKKGFFEFFLYYIIEKNFESGKEAKG